MGMAWLALDKENVEIVCDYKPHRIEDTWDCYGNIVELPQGTIKKIIGRDLTWEDDPVEIK